MAHFYIPQILFMAHLVGILCYAWKNDGQLPKRRVNFNWCLGEVFIWLLLLAWGGFFNQ